MIIAAVLAGGASVRMGEPKAVLDLDGRPMAARVADALRAAGAERVLLVGGDPQWPADLGLEPVPDRWPGAGPLAGVATALSAGPGATSVPDGETVVLVAACDQPDLSSATLRLLVDALDAALSPVAVATLRSPDGRRHPFPSAWRLSAAEALVDLVESGARRADAAFDVVEVIDVVLDDATLADLDTPDDVDRWRTDRSSLARLRPRNALTEER